MLGGGARKTSLPWIIFERLDLCGCNETSTRIIHFLFKEDLWIYPCPDNAATTSLQNETVEKHETSTKISNVLSNRVKTIVKSASEQEILSSEESWKELPAEALNAVEETFSLQ